MSSEDYDKVLSLLDDPLKFTLLCWPKIKLYDKQAEVLYSVRDNLETYVHAANEVGKDFIAAIVAIWFFASRSPARVITSSSGETQLEQILWSEIKQRIATSEYVFPWKVDHLRIRRFKNGKNGAGYRNGDDPFDPLSYIIGHVTKTVENFQGHHLPQDKARVLYIGDEASGIDDPFYDAADSWAHRKLIIGNPLNAMNFFYRHCKGGDMPDPADQSSGRLLRKVIHVDALDSPNVKIGMHLRSLGYSGPLPTIIPGVVSYDDYLRRDARWDKVKKHIRLHGLFWEGEGALLFPPNWLDACEAEFARIAALGDAFRKQRKAKALGLDIGEGGDDTSWSIVDEVGLLDQVVKSTPNTMDIVRDTLTIGRQWGIPPEDWVLDLGSGGKMIADRLRELGYKVRGVNFGESPTPPDPKNLRKGPPTRADEYETRMVFLNRRAEMYWMLHEMCDPQSTVDLIIDGKLVQAAKRPAVFALPEENYLLRQELAILPILYQEGKMYLPPKNRKITTKETTESNIITIRSLLGRSPDRADSLVLAVFGMLTKKPVRIVGVF